MTLTAKEVDAEITEVCSVLDRTRNLHREICAAANIVNTAVALGGKVIFAGNGGSATQAVHLAAELVGRFKAERDSHPALALCENIASLTAIANDYSYDEVFSRQLRAFGRRGDVLILLSTSGRSRNVVLAAVAARDLGLEVIALCGAGGGTLRDLVDVTINVPSSDVAHIQDVHLVLGHLLCWAAERTIVDRSGSMLTEPPGDCNIK